MADKNTAGAAGRAPEVDRPDKIRNVVLVGPSGSGKTTLVEQLLVAAGALTRAGRVEEGTTVSDFDEAEVRQQRSVGLALAPLEVDGIKVNLVPLEKNAFVEMLEKKPSYDAALHGYVITDMEPSSLLSGLKVGGGQRYWFVGQKQAKEEWEKEFDRLVSEIDTTPDFTARKQKSDAAQKLIAEQLPLIPLVVRNFASGAKTTLGNYRPSVIIPRSLWNAEELFWKK